MYNVAQRLAIKHKLLAINTMCLLEEIDVTRHVFYYEMKRFTLILMMIH